jgi:hypothetical protein
VKRYSKKGRTNEKECDYKIDRYTEYVLFCVILYMCYVFSGKVIGLSRYSATQPNPDSSTFWNSGTHLRDQYIKNNSHI